MAKRYVIGTGEGDLIRSSLYTQRMVEQKHG